MVLIPRGQRLVSEPGGAVLPSPSGQRIQIAGMVSREVAQLGQTIQQIGEKAQRAADNAEFEKATIDAQSKVNDKLAELKQSIQDPAQFKQSATEEINKIITGAGNDIGFRNRQRFKGVTGRIKLNADKAIVIEGFGKTVDLSKATFELVKDSNIEGVLLGTLTEAEAIRNIDIQTDDRTRNGILNLQENVEEKKAFRARLAEVKFEKDFLTDPVKAIKDLQANVNIGIEAKTNLIDKATRKATHLRAVKNREMKLDRENREFNAFKRARTDDYSEDDLDQDTKDNPENPMGEDARRRILNKIHEVDRTGGLGNPDAFNKMLRNMRLNPRQFVLGDIYALADAEDLNNVEIDKLEAEFSSLTTGKSDPSDITTFREYGDTQDSVKRLFAPSQFDIGAEFGVKNLRFDEAYRFARGKARDLYKDNRNVDDVMSQVFTETLKHMEEYDKLVERFRDSGRLDPDNPSVLAIEKLIRPALEHARVSRENITSFTAPPFGPTEEGLTEEQLNEIEVIFDNADSEDRELTEEEVKEIERIQEAKEESK